MIWTWKDTILLVILSFSWLIIYHLFRIFEYLIKKHMKSNFGKASLIVLVAIIIIVAGIVGFNYSMRKPAPEKPFTISSKFPYPDGNCKFEYYDATDHHYEFTDRCEKYSVGDVIK
jgi:hypothetical protein